MKKLLLWSLVFVAGAFTLLRVVAKWFDRSGVFHADPMLERVAFVLLMCVGVLILVVYKVVESCRKPTPPALKSADNVLAGGILGAGLVAAIATASPVSLLMGTGMLLRGIFRRLKG